MPDLIILLVGGALAGTLGGLLGIGGGIVLMPLLRFFVDLPPAHAAGTCIIAVFFTTLGGGSRYYRMGYVNLRAIVPVIISGAVATVVFSLLFRHLAMRERWLDLGIGLVFSLVAARMIGEGLASRLGRKADEPPVVPAKGSLWQKMTIGGAAGVLPGLLGIGTGGVLVPAFTFVLGWPVKVAVACSLACFCVNALISSAIKLSQGFVELDVALLISLGTLVGANLGALINRHFPSATIKLIFGLVFAYVSLKFVFSFFGVEI